MGVFQSQKTVPVQMTDLAPVAQAVASHFQAKGFEVKSQRTDKGWHVSVSKADTFKVVMGTKTALNVEIEPKGNGTEISAGIGVFGQQSGGLGSIMAGPLMITQLWGMVQQSKLDDEALAVAEKALHETSAAATKAAADRVAAARAAAEMQAEMQARRREEEAAAEAEAKAAAARAAVAAKARMEAEIAARVRQQAEDATRAEAAAAAKARMEAEIAARVQQEHAETEARVQAAAEAAAKAEAEAKAKAEAAAQAREALGGEPQPVGTRGVLGGSERTYVVAAGDSLYKIAARFYGSGSRWPEIFEANKDIIKNPRIIRPGQKLRIP